MSADEDTPDKMGSILHVRPQLTSPIWFERDFRFGVIFNHLLFCKQTVKTVTGSFV